MNPYEIIFIISIMALAAPVVVMVLDIVYKKHPYKKKQLAYTVLFFAVSAIAIYITKEEWNIAVVMKPVIYRLFIVPLILASAALTSVFLAFFVLWRIKGLHRPKAYKGGGIIRTFVKEMVTASTIGTLGGAAILFILSTINDLNDTIVNGAVAGLIVLLIMGLVSGTKKGYKNERGGGAPFN